MANKMDRFTQAARTVLKHAQEFAEGLKHSQIEPVDILLAMTNIKTLPVCDILAAKGISLEKLLLLVRASIVENPPAMNLDLSEDVKKVLYLSVEAAKQQEHSFIGTHHLLVGLMRLEHEGMKSIFVHFQIEANDIIKVVEAYWAEHAEELKIKQIDVGDPLIVDVDVAPLLLTDEMGCFEAVKQALFFRKKKNDE